METSRRKFLSSISLLALAGTLPISAFDFGMSRKLKVVLVGTGVRGIGFWGKNLVKKYSDILEFVGISDINPGRMAYAAEYMGVSCQQFSDFDEMISKTSPD